MNCMHAIAASDDRELRSLGTQALSWPVVITLRVPHGSAVISHVPPALGRRDTFGERRARPTLASPVRGGYSLVLALVLIVLNACNRLPQQVREVVRPSAPVALTVDIVVDSGEGAATPAGVAATIRAAVAAAVSRPGSVVRLFQVGESRVSESRLVVGYAFPPPSKPSRRAVLLHEREHRAAANHRLLRASERLFTARSRRQTRIAETLSIVALAGNPTRGTRVIVIESDLRETSIADLECTTPEASIFIDRLDTAGLLRPGSLRETTVWFAHARPNDVEGDRCTSSVRHFTDLTSLWRVVLERAGAKVLMTSGVPEMTR